MGQGSNKYLKMAINKGDKVARKVDPTRMLGYSIGTVYPNIVIVEITRGRLKGHLKRIPEAQLMKFK
jgi:hypothetical protein